MIEHRAEPPAADVRSFLPRPGEPVEDYAARLRALHHDLSLVLDAVERGLAAAEADAMHELREVAAPEPYEVVAEPHRSPPPQGPPAAARGSARVEVVTTPAASGAAGGGHAWSGPPEPEGSAPWGGRRAPEGEGAPAWGEPAAPSPERSWVERTAEQPPPWQQPPSWTERRPSAWPPPPPPPAEMSFAPPYPPPRRRGLGIGTLPPLVLAAAILGWLVAVALVLALAFGL